MIMNFPFFVYVWRFIGSPLFSIIPYRPFVLRRVYLRFWGASLAPSTRIYGGVQIFNPKKLFMGEGSCLGSGVKILNTDWVSIGANSIVSFEAVICTASKRRSDDGRWIFCESPIRIGDSCFIGAQAFLTLGAVVKDEEFVKVRQVVSRS